LYLVTLHRTHPAAAVRGRTGGKTIAKLVETHPNENIAFFLAHEVEELIFSYYLDVRNH